MLKMVDGTGIIGLDMICPLGISTPQPPNYDRVELEGTGMLVLPNSLDAPLERLELGGKTGQFSTKGLNLFNYKDFVDISTYADEGAGYRRKYLQLKPNTSYRMTIFKNRMSPSMDATVMFIGNKEKYDNTAANGTIALFTSTDKKSATIVTGESGQIVFKLNKNSTPELQEEYLSKADIILSEGSTEIPYEPYTGGKPSPSPEYPQAIKNVGKWNEEKQKYEVDVKVTGKNLFDAKKAKSGWITPDGKQTLVALGSVDNVVSDYIQVYPGMNYTSSASVFQNFYDSEKNFLNHITNASTSIVVPDNAKYMIVVIAVNKALVIQTANTLMINIGSSRTDFESYKEQSLTLTSDRPLTKWDRLVEQGGQIGWLYKSAINEYRGDTVIAIYGTGFYFLLNNKKLKSGEGYCEELKQHVPSDEKPCISFNMSSNTYAYTLNTQAIYGSTVSAIKEYLKTHPLHLVYKTETTEFIPLPEKEQNAIRALKTYYPTTVITADGGELYPDIKVTYRKEK